MSNLFDSYSSKSNIFDKSVQINSSKHPQLFSDKNSRFESSFTFSKTDPRGFTKMLPRQSMVTPQVNQLFKVPTFDHIPVKKATVRSIKSPVRRVQTGRVKNDLKGQQSKLSMIPRPSFINSRKSLHGSRCSQLNARKELIKKMVYLAECSLKENQQIMKNSPKPNKILTPVKMLAGLTPKKTPRSGGYFILPEFQKKVPKLEDVRNPVQDLIKKEIFSYSAKPLLSEKKNHASVVQESEDNNSSFFERPVEEEATTEKNNMPDKNGRFTAILSHCENYNTEVKTIHEKLKHLDESFHNQLKNLPEYKVYSEFCFYQSKKEELYKELHNLELDLKNFVSTHTKIYDKLKTYVKKKHEFFERQINLHKDFERAVNSALGKCEKTNKVEIVEEEKVKVNTPKLRRSLRLSKIKEKQVQERTPMTRRLKKLDTKSKGIQKCRKVRSP